MKAVGVAPIGIGARRPSSVVVGPVHLPLGGAVEPQQAVVPDADVGIDAGTPELDALLRAKGVTSVDDLPDANGVPKCAYMQPEDIGAIKGFAISGLVYVGAVLGARSTAAAAPLFVPMLAAAAVSGATGGGVGAFLTRRLGSERSAYIAESLAHGGLVIWVSTQGDERHFVDMMREQGGEHIHARSMADV